MKTPILIILNLGLLVLFIYLFRNRELLSYHHKGRWWLTWLAIGVITLMDEFTSIFYVPAEAYRFIGLSAPSSLLPSPACLSGFFPPG